METDYNRHMDLAHRQRHPSLSPPRSRKDSQDSLSHYTHGQSPPPLKINDMNNIDLFATRAPQYHSSTSPLPKVNGRGSPLESRDYMSSRPKYLSTSSSAGSPPPRQRSPVRSPVGDHLKGNGEQERSKDKVLSPPITPTDLSVKPVRTSESGSPGMEERSSHGSRDDDMKMDHHQDLMEEDRDMDRGNQSDWTFEEQFKQVGLQIFSYRYIKWGLCISHIGVHQNLTASWQRGLKSSQTEHPVHKFEEDGAWGVTHPQISLKVHLLPQNVEKIVFF